MGQRIVLAVVLACVLSSCQKKPEGQTIAIVNNEEITAADLNGELANMTNVGPNPGKELRAEALERLINRRLLAQQAKAEGLDKTPEFLNQVRRGTDDLLINMLVSRQTKTQQVPSAADIAKFEASRPGTFANREIWTLQQIIYPLPKDPAVTARIAAANSLDEVAQALTSASIRFTRATKQFDSAMLPPALYNQLSHLGPGEPFIAPGPGQAAASVITARQPAPLSPEQQRQVALVQMRGDQVNKVLNSRVKELKAKAKIEYQPGFGPAKK